MVTFSDLLVLVVMVLAAVSLPAMALKFLVKNRYSSLADFQHIFEQSQFTFGGKCTIIIKLKGGIYSLAF